MLIAAKIVHDECAKNICCNKCQLCDICYDTCPKDWKIPEPPPEPAERQRIEWLRMLPDDEMLDVMDYSHFSLECADCYNVDSEGECLRKSFVECCDAGHADWWHEVVSLEKFRKDVGLNERV